MKRAINFKAAEFSQAEREDYSFTQFSRKRVRTFQVGDGFEFPFISFTCPKIKQKLFVTRIKRQTAQI